MTKRDAPSPNVPKPPRGRRPSSLAEPPAAESQAQVIPKSKQLKLQSEPGVSTDRLVAEVAAKGLVANAATVVAFSSGTFGEVSLNDSVAALSDMAKSVHGGDLKVAESMLIAQASTLNSIFTELARHASLNMGTYLDATDKYIRLALKAQAQSRQTLETLAMIKNPPIVYAKQANFAAGAQQVNNGVPSAVSPMPFPIERPAPGLESASKLWNAPMPEQPAHSARPDNSGKRARGEN